VLYLGILRQHDRLLRRTLLGSKGAPPPRADSFLGREMRARGAQAKRVPSWVTDIYIYTNLYTFHPSHRPARRRRSSLVVSK